MPDNSQVHVSGTIGSKPSVAKVVAGGSIKSFRKPKNVGVAPSTTKRGVRGTMRIVGAAKETTSMSKPRNVGKARKLK